MTEEQAGSIAESLHFIDRTLRAIRDMAEGIAPPARVRNVDARCGNCPYYTGPRDTVERPGLCCLNTIFEEMSCANWCGQHPNFWKES